MDEKRTDTANEPVSSTDDGDFMDTGVLHTPTPAPETCTDLSCAMAGKHEWHSAR